MTKEKIKRPSRTVKDYQDEYEKIRHKYKLHILAKSLNSKDAQKLSKRLWSYNALLNKLMWQSKVVGEDGSRVDDMSVLTQLMNNQTWLSQPTTNNTTLYRKK
jgi:hypothetical protein